MGQRRRRRSDEVDFYMNRSASTSIFHATHIHTQRTLSNVLLSTRLLTAQIQHSGKERERERGKEAFGTTSSYASVGRGTTRAVIDNTIPTQWSVSCNYIYAICKPIQSRASVVQKLWKYARLSVMKREDFPVRY